MYKAIASSMATFSVTYGGLAGEVDQSWRKLTGAEIMAALTDHQVDYGDAKQSFHASGK